MVPRSVLRLAALLPLGALADLPVHCLRHQILGDWEFSLSPAKTERPACGHHRPDDQDRQPPVSLLASLGPTTALRLSVQDPDSVSTSKGDVGTWTMIYDEGWEVAVGGKVFFAFSMFEMVPDGHGGQTNVSHCDETLLGWYRDSTRTRWGCYHGRKAGHKRAKQTAAPEAQGAAARGAAAAARGASAAGRSSALVGKASIFDYSALSAPDAGSDAAAEAAGLDASADGAGGRAAQDDESDAGASADDQGAPAPPPGRAAAPAADGGAEAAPTVAAEPPAQPEAPAAAAQSEAPAQSEAEQSALAALVQSGEEEEQDEEAEGAESGADGAAQPAPEHAAAQPAAAAGQRAPSSLADVYDVPSSYTPWVPRSAGYDKPMQHRWQQAVAEALNFMQLGWTATAHSMFVGKTPRELNRFAGTRRARIPPQRRSPGPLAGEALSFISLRSRRKRAPSKESLDWRRVNGKNWLEPVVSQGDCGSCYAISTVRMMTSRNRIARGDPSEPAFSVTFPLQCSEYNQGCNGGYGFLESKWAEDVGLVPEQCAPFTDDPGACQALEDCELGDRRYRAVNHRYVGGFYGGSDHEQIKQELVTNGPLVLSFEPKEDFMYYKSGLYKSGLNKIHQEWEQVDHAVLLMGLGTDAGQPYWVLQNSWGTQWGEEGFFRMARGIDESGCESIAVAADVVQDSSNDVLDNFLASL